MILTTILQSIVFALPNGAPGCTTPRKAMNSTSADLGYHFQSTTLKDGQWGITINSCKGRSEYQGLLLWVADPNHPNKHLGTFQFKNQTKWKFKNVGECRQKNVSINAFSTVTHAAPDKVPVGMQVFAWTCPPNIDLNNLKVFGVVADKNDKSDRVPLWQALEPMDLIKKRTLDTMATTTTVMSETATRCHNGHPLPTSYPKVPEISPCDSNATEPTTSKPGNQSEPTPLQTEIQFPVTTNSNRMQGYSGWLLILLMAIF